MNRNTIPVGSSLHLENLIEAYCAALWALPFERQELDALALALDREAEHIGYQDHDRIAAIRLMGEQVEAALEESAHATA